MKQYKKLKQKLEKLEKMKAHYTEIDKTSKKLANLQRKLRKQKGGMDGARLSDAQAGSRAARSGNVAERLRAQEEFEKALAEMDEDQRRMHEKESSAGKKPAKAKKDAKGKGREGKKSDE